MTSVPDPVATPPRRVLVVEDEPRLRELVELHARIEGLDPVGGGDGTEALRVASVEPFDLVVLDLMLPGLDGMAVCRAIRRGSINREVPILILTARSDESDKVEGLESGADDYLTKPFGIRELVARMRALLRRPTLSRLARDVEAERGRISVAGLTIDPARRQARLADRDVELTGLEFDLLDVLAAKRGTVFTRDTLVGRVWKGERFVTERSVNTLIKRLRKKIETNPEHPRYLLTVWGAGYKFADVSHELKTPLSSIRGYVETLQMPTVAFDGPARRRDLAIVGEEAEKLTRLVGDLLDLARLETAGLSLARQPVPIDRLWVLSGPKIRASERRDPASEGAPVFTVGGRYTSRGWTDWTEGFR